MFGVHHEMGLFVAVDPAMHSPTWFSMSIEMKEAHLDEALDVGWAAWERRRSAARRKIDAPLLNLQTEAICAFRPEFFLRYVAGRASLQAASTPGSGSCSPTVSVGRPAYARRSSLRSGPARGGSSALGCRDPRRPRRFVPTARRGVRGSVAAHHLETVLGSAAGVTEVQRIDEDGQPDFKLRYRARSDGVPRVDFQMTLFGETALGNNVQPVPTTRRTSCSQHACTREQAQLVGARAGGPGKLSSKAAVRGDAWPRALGGGPFLAGGGRGAPSRPGRPRPPRGRPRAGRRRGGVPF